MQAADAAALFGVEPTDRAKAAERSREMEADLKSKISSAPTATLRSSYQKSLQQVLDARAALGVPTDGSANNDLPASSAALSSGESNEPVGDSIPEGGVDAPTPTGKKGRAVKIAAGVGAAVLGLAALNHLGAEEVTDPKKDGEGGEGHHHRAHEADPDDQHGNDDPFGEDALGAAMKEIASIDISSIETPAVPSLDSWLVVDDPNPPELHGATYDATAASDATLGSATHTTHVSIDMSPPSGTSGDDDFFGMSGSSASVGIVSSGPDHTLVHLFGADAPPTSPSSDEDDLDD